MNDKNKIGFGIMLGGLLCALLLTIAFGNDKEVLLTIPVIILGAILYE